MAFLRYSLKRSALGVGLVLVSATLVFFLMRLLGNPIAIALGSRATDAEIAARTKAAGLDRPIVVQYLDYLQQLGSGSLGETILTQESVLGQISQSIPATVELGLAILLATLAVGLPIGTYLALRRGTKLDSSFRVGTILMYALPSFVFAVFLKLFFSVWIPIFPSSGRMKVESSILLQTPNQTGFAVLDSMFLGNLNVLADVLLHLALPAISIGLIIGASFTRAVRVAIVAVLDSDWYLEAKNRLGDGFRVRVRHLFLPASAPIINAFGLHAIAVLTGLVFVERIFEIRGLGYLLTDAIISRDYSLVQGITIIVAVVVVVINLITDLISGAIDPRYRSVIR